MTAPRLQASLGYSSLTGPRPRNEDFCGAATPEGPELDAKGILAVVADGVGGHANGREASEYTVRGLLSDYYATPDTWIQHWHDKYPSATPIAFSSRSVPMKPGKTPSAAPTWPTRRWP